MAQPVPPGRPGRGLTPGKLHFLAALPRCDKDADPHLLVDDYDLVATQQGSPVLPLVPLLPQARDIGLHLVLTRRSGGASRALYEPVVQALHDLAAPGLLLSGSPEEGPLLGRAKPQPAPAGRGQLVSRDRGVEIVQTAWTVPLV